MQMSRRCRTGSGGRSRPMNLKTDSSFFGRFFLYVCLWFLSHKSDEEKVRMVFPNKKENGGLISIRSLRPDRRPDSFARSTDASRRLLLVVEKSRVKESSGHFVGPTRTFSQTRRVCVCVCVCVKEKMITITDRRRAFRRRERERREKEQPKRSGGVFCCCWCCFAAVGVRLRSVLYTGHDPRRIVRCVGGKPGEKPKKRKRNAGTETKKKRED